MVDLKKCRSSRVIPLLSIGSLLRDLQEWRQFQVYPEKRDDPEVRQSRPGIWRRQVILRGHGIDTEILRQVLRTFPRRYATP